MQPRNGGIPDGKEREREREGAINTDVKPRTDRGLSSCRESFSNFATRAAQNIYMHDAFLRSAGIVRNVDRRIKLPTLRAKNECAFVQRSSRKFLRVDYLLMEIAGRRRRRSSWAATTRKFEAYANHMSRCQRSE